ncbi:MAG: hypothetical protein FWC68_03635 [Oscillospiraceae bacterium]|nr:hypothetical protein [Oscillospiraceae bacterium]
MSKTRKTGIIGIIITILLLISLVIVTNIDTATFSGAENIFGRLVMPIQNGLTSLRNRMARKYWFL